MVWLDDFYLFDVDHGAVRAVGCCWFLLLLVLFEVVLLVVRF